MRHIARLQRAWGRDDGAALIVVAISLLVIMGFLALALDGGRGLSERSDGQNAVDHAAISGAWAKCNGENPVTAAENFIVLNGYLASEIVVDANYGPDSVEVVLRTSIEGEISPVIGVNNIDVAARAVASCVLNAGGGGDIPFGAPGGGDFTGIAQTLNPCGTGNCHALRIPRDDINGLNNQLIRNIALGSQPELVASWNDETSTPVCQAGDSQCTVLDAKQGVAAGPLSTGLIRGSKAQVIDGRLENLASALTPEGQVFQTPMNRDEDGDEYWHILDGISGQTGSKVIVGLDAIRAAVGNTIGWVSKWQDEVHGDFDTVKDPQNRHIYYDGVVRKCDSPRIAEVPIVTNDLDWGPSDGPPPFLSPGNSGNVKVIGSYDLIIHQPIVAGDLAKSDTIKTINAWIVWYGPKATCANGSTPGKPTTDVFIVTLDE